MNARTCIAAAAVAALAACSDDTGILVEVHGDDLPQAVIRLDTMVVLDVEHRPDSAAWGSADRRQITVEADLRERPYTVMLRPDGVPNDATVWMAALAYDGNGTVIGFGELDGPVAFTPDLVKKVAMRLRPAQQVADGCVAKGDHVVVRTTDDCDRDGVTYHTDCDDLDALVGGDEDGDPVVCGDDCDMTRADVYPGNAEVCDGVDNDCDPISQPPPRMCVQVEHEGDLRFCRVGQALCTELGGNAQYGACTVAALDVETNSRLCEKWAACIESGADDCFVDGRLRCDLGFAGIGQPCVPATTELRDLVETNQCTWRLVTSPTSGSWRIGLRPRGSTIAPVTFVAECDAELVVVQADAIPRLVVLEAAPIGQDDARMFSMTIEPRRADCDPQQPSELACRTVAP